MKQLRPSPSQDFERVITHHIQSGQYKKALEVLQQHKSSELFYKFSPALMAHVPYLTVEAWIEARDQADTAAAGQPLIEPRKLIPALMRYDPSSTTFADSDDVPTDEVGSNQAVRFLLDCIEHGVTDRAIHNYLISELASQPSEEALMRFLNNKRSKTKAGGDEGGERCYDVKYALRQCMAAGKQRAVVYLYGELGLYEEAVERALALGDLQLALANAERPALQELDGVGGLGSKGSDENSELRKRLWLRIARNVAEHKKNIRAAINLMAQSEGLLKIEDILPFFPEFAKIDDFKDEICDSLDHYNQDIEELKLAMAETTESSERIR